MSLASRKLIQATAGAAGAVDTGDDDFANVVLLLDGDGTSGDDNNTFTDSSTNGFTVTESGSVVQGSFSPYGDNWSVYFENDTAFMQSDTAIAVSTDNFTIEMWVWTTEADVRFCSQNAIGGTNFYFGTNSAGKLRWDVPTGTNVVSADYVMPLNQWVHVAAVREGTGSNQFKMYADGVLVAQSTDSSAHGSSRKINIAGGRGNSANYDGYISNFRFVVGSAVYTSAFTPPTAPLTNITNTKLLACQSNRFIDNSSTNDTFTLDLDSGLPKVTPFSPFKDDDARDITTDGGSAYFDGSSYLSTPNDTAYRPNTGAYTVEGWFYITKSTTQMLFDARQTGSTDQRVGFWVTNGDDLNYWHGTGTSTSSNVFSTGEWVYIAASRGSGTTEIYVNGTRTKSFSDSTQLYNFRPYYGARWDAGAKLDEGYLADWRITVGEKLYTGTTMTVPTAPIGLHSSTDSYLAFQDAGIYDRSGINNLDTVGNAQIDTAVKKYGTGSLEFDGTGDYLLLEENMDNFEFGSGDFTIEFWLYTNDATANQTLIDFRPASTNGLYPLLYIPSGATEDIRYYVNGANRITSSTISSNAWMHVAVARSGSSTKLFIDGTQQGSTYTDSNNYALPSRVTIGAGSLNLGGAPLDGFIDDLRITKGIARYTSNFTPPDAALPKF